MPAPAWLRTQLSGPSGILARPMAYLLNRGNSDDYVRALEQLPVRDGDSVLELGFGGGVGVSGLLAKGANVVGVEPSAAMRARAYRKFAWDLADGRLRIETGRAEALPVGPFDHAISMNTVYFWDDVQAGMAELARKVTGTVLLGVAPKKHLNDLGFETSGFRVASPTWYGEQMAQAGFDVYLQPKSSGQGCTLVVGRMKR